jgi:hypothetical protein
LEVDWIVSQIRDNEKIMKAFAIKKKKIADAQNISKVKKRLKMEVIKNQYMDLFLVDFLKKKSVVIKIKNKLVLDYFRKNQSVLHSNNSIVTPLIKSSQKKAEYDTIMKELDELLDNASIKTKSFIEPLRLEEYTRKTKSHSEALMQYLYFEKTGRDRFRYGKYGLDFYDRTGEEPWTYSTLTFGKV